MYKIARSHGLLPSQLQHAADAVLASSSNTTNSLTSTTTTSASNKAQKRKYAEVEARDYESLDYIATMKKPTVAALLVPVSRKLIGGLAL